MGKLLRSKYLWFVLRLILPKKALWKVGTILELRFWDRFLKTKHGCFENTYKKRINPNMPLQPEIAELIKGDSLNILDVGSGALTSIGKKFKDVLIEITACDPLADKYSSILLKYNVPVTEMPIKIESEKLSLFDWKFDIAFAQNSLDHSINPEKIILEMLKVIKDDGYVVLKHRENEADREGFIGLHQWNFTSINDEFVMSDRREVINFSEKHNYKTKCKRITDDEGEWLLVTIKK